MKDAREIMKDCVWIINNLFKDKEIVYSAKDKQYSIFMGNKEDIQLTRQTQYFVDYNILEQTGGNLETGETIYFLKNRLDIVRWLTANSTSNSPHLLTLDKNDFTSAIRSLKLSKLNID
jgi:hypothetical protein